MRQVSKLHRALFCCAEGAILTFGYAIFYESHDAQQKQKLVILEHALGTALLKVCVVLLISVRLGAMFPDTVLARAHQTLAARILSIVSQTACQHHAVCFVTGLVT